MLGEEKGTRRDGELVKATSHRLTSLSITSLAETEPRTTMGQRCAGSRQMRQPGCARAGPLFKL